MAKKRKRKNKPNGVIPGFMRIRDELMVMLINGATKAGAYKDRKKERDRTACRGKTHNEE